MKIKVEVQDKNQMRYSTLGDYYYVKFQDTLHFKIADTGNDNYNKLILIHELIEELLTSNAGISEASITKWDKEHLELLEPGAHEEAPYHKEHMIAEEIERFLCDKIGISWNEYDNQVETFLYDY